MKLRTFHFLAAKMSSGIQIIILNAVGIVKMLQNDEILEKHICKLDFVLEQTVYVVKPGLSVLMLIGG